MPSRHGDGWSARWMENGKRCRETFRARRDAEVFERKKKAEQEEIKHGLRGAPPQERTFEQLCDYWIENRVPQKRSGHHDRSIIRAHLRPVFGRSMLQEIGVAQLDRFIVERGHLSKKTLANHLTLLGTMLNVARDLGWLATLPRIRKPKVRIFSADFSYLRTDEEIRRFLIAAREDDENGFAFYASAIYTGMRAGELAGLHWGDVNFERRFITVQRSYDGPTKAEDVRYVPILDPLMPLLRERRLAISNRLVLRGAASVACARSLRRRTRAGTRDAARAALRRPRPSRGLRDDARRGPLSLLGAHDVSDPRGQAKCASVATSSDT